MLWLLPVLAFLSGLLIVIVALVKTFKSLMRSLAKFSNIDGNWKGVKSNRVGFKDGEIIISYTMPLKYALDNLQYAKEAKEQVKRAKYKKYRLIWDDWRTSHSKRLDKEVENA